MKYESFNTIYKRAINRFGSEEALLTHLSSPVDHQALQTITDDRWLSAFSQKVFQSGINWQVVRDKWPGFEEVFLGFDIEKMLFIDHETWAKKAKDTRIIRHLGKVMTIPQNALMIHDCQIEQGSFSHFIAAWPSDNIVGLWQYLKQHGSRLGGNTGPYTLRTMGKDTFLLTKDVEGYLRTKGIIDSGKETKTALNAAQTAFNYWREETKLPLCQISQCIAYGVN